MQIMATCCVCVCMEEVAWGKACQVSAKAANSANKQIWEFSSSFITLYCSSIFLARYILFNMICATPPPPKKKIYKMNIQMQVWKLFYLLNDLYFCTSILGTGNLTFLCCTSPVCYWTVIGKQHIDVLIFLLSLLLSEFSLPTHVYATHLIGS